MCINDGRCILAQVKQTERHVSILSEITPEQQKREKYTACLWAWDQIVSCWGFAAASASKLQLSWSNIVKNTHYGTL